MSCKTIVTLLMLSCLGATGTALGVTEEPPLEGGVETLPPCVHLIITDVRWLKKEGSTNVQVCVKNVLPAGTAELSYDDGVNNVIATEGVIDADLHCANFTKNATYTFTEIPARYELIVVSADDPGVLLGRGVSTFAITVRSTLLKCGDSPITKVTWSKSERLSLDFDCIKGSANLEQTCYHDGNITGTERCFWVTEEKDLPVKVCLNGPVDNHPHSTIVLISANYFFYGPDAVNNVAVDATLSLTTEIGQTNMRAIVREAEGLPSPEATRVAHVYDCSAVDCTFPTYERKLATYEMCLDAMNDSLATIETATTTFTDLNLNAFDGDAQKNLLLECVFANGLPGMKYTANLLDKLPEVGVEKDLLSTSHIDCTGVSLNHACFGYLDADSPPGTALYVTVSDTDGLNTIIAPFTMP